MVANDLCKADTTTVVMFKLFITCYGCIRRPVHCNNMMSFKMLTRAVMGVCTGLYRCTRGPLWVHVSGSLQLWNHKQYQHRYLSTFIVTILSKTCFVCFVALRPKSTAMVMAGRSVHLSTLFPGQA